MKKPNVYLPHSGKQQLSSYYRFQSRIYDLTRWSFLFGRRSLIKHLPLRTENRFRVLEVGCGTGKNLVEIAKKFPHAEITGIDLSEDMLNICRKKIKPFNGRITSIHGAFGEVRFKEKFDLIVFSYCLTMANPGWEKLLRLTSASLRPKGIIAVVDFHDSSIAAFRRHMSNHHVCMEGQLLPELNDLYRASEVQINKAYLGVWRWLLFIGEPRTVF
jgi:S-adenosylmethionine-diacylgycerolhomoserine-N-methlytransferase